jgi:hypothetical protein
VYDRARIGSARGGKFFTCRVVAGKLKTCRHNLAAESRTVVLRTAKTPTPALGRERLPLRRVKAALKRGERCPLAG